MVSPERAQNNQNLAMPESLNDGQKAWEVITAFLRKRKLTWTGGCKVFYSPREWKERGEEFGHDSLLIVVHDGGAHARAFNPDYEDQKTYEAMTRELHKHGFWMEAQTCWYTAIYKL